MLTLIWCPFHPLVTAVARKRPLSFCQKCGWRVIPKHTYIHDPAKSTGLNMPLFKRSVGTYKEMSSYAICQGNTRPQSSQLAEPLWIDPCLKSGISVCNNKKSTGGERMDEHSPPNSCKQEKIHHQKNAQTWLAYTEMHM